MRSRTITRTYNDPDGRQITTSETLPPEDLLADAPNTPAADGAPMDSGDFNQRDAPAVSAGRTPTIIAADAGNMPGKKAKAPKQVWDTNPAKAHGSDAAPQELADSGAQPQLSRLGNIPPTAEEMRPSDNISSGPTAQIESDAGDRGGKGVHWDPLLSRKEVSGPTGKAPKYVSTWEP